MTILRKAKEFIHVALTSRPISATINSGLGPMKIRILMKTSSLYWWGKESMKDSILSIKALHRIISYLSKFCLHRSRNFKSKQKVKPLIIVEGIAMSMVSLYLSILLYLMVFVYSSRFWHIIHSRQWCIISSASIS